MALLALLALHAPRSVGRSELIDALWGEQPPASAVNAVQVLVSALRKSLGPASIVIAGDGYRLGNHIGVDVDEFIKATRRGAGELARGQAAAAAGTLRAALDLWRGPALGGLDAAPFLAAERDRLEETRLSVLEQRIDADLRIGRHREVVTELESLVTLHPLHEGLRGLLMQALYRCGRQAEALAAYDVGRRVLREELGIDPSPDLRAVHQRLLNQRDTDPARSDLLSGSRRELPALLDETVGRADELVALETMLGDGRGRLVTVMGTGGVGKTRLAIALGAHLASTSSAAVVFVPLSHAEKPADVPATICQALGVRSADDALATVESALADKRTLLICDNFEHVLDAASLLSGWLAVAPDLQILATSRQPLGIRGERLFHLEPLPVSENHASQPSPAARLFVARVRDSDPTFQPTVDELADISSIARKCDGLPLALELAAARTRALPLAELNRRLSDPLSLLATGARDVPERQRTLRSSIAWSVGALTGGQARFLAQLTVFRGGCTLAAAAGVTGCEPDEALEHIEALLDRCLIQRQLLGGQHRFGLLETIGEYAAELLGDELPEVQRRHARYFRDWMRPLPEPTRTGVSPATWQAHLAEQANLRNAVRWALAGSDGELAADLVIVAASVWDQSGPQTELEQWFGRLLERQDISPGRRCDVYWWQATLHSSGDLRRMAAPLEAARSLAEEQDDTRRLVWIEIVAVLGEILKERPNDALAAVRQGQALAAGHPETTTIHVSILLLNGQLAAAGAVSDAAALRDRQQEVAATSGKSIELRSVILANLSELMLRRNDAAKALRFAEAGVALAGQASSPAGLADSLTERGCARFVLGMHAEAMDDLRAAMGGHLNLGSMVFARRDLARLAVVAVGHNPAAAAIAVGVAAQVAAAPQEPAAWLGEAESRGLAAGFVEEHASQIAGGRALVADLGERAALAAALNGFYSIAPA